MKKILKNVRNCNSLLLLMFCSILGSCRKLVTVSAPYTQQVTSTVFSSATSATAAMTAIYAQISNQALPFYVPAFTGISGDELTTYSSTADIVGFYTNSLTAMNLTLASDLWDPPYVYIFQANALIDGIGSSTGISPPVSRQLIGEAKFIRAFWNFYLVNLYGNVPLVTSTDYTVTSVEARSASGKVYQAIVTDLMDAQAALSSNFVDITDTTTTIERTRPTSWAASALLARVYLYMGDWVDAEKQATTVIGNSSMFQLVTPLKNVFLKNSQEAIWQIQPVTTPNGNTPEGTGFILTTAPATSGLDITMTLSPQLRAAFEPGDERFTTWVDSVASAYFPYKYRLQGNVTPTSEYSMVLRLAEQYLIRSEARAHQGNISGATGALIDLNSIRERAGLTDYAGAPDTTSVLSAIMHERQVELFGEWGHRWLDLKRTGAIDGVMGGQSGVCASKGGTWESSWGLYPIPQAEINNDPNLSQNSNY